MDGELAATAAGGGGGGTGGPAPFLMKTYEMVDDSTTNEIVSWSPNKKSFIVWNPLEFARILLPTYFKHNNFSSFIRQLNTYGFHKTEPERWEFANENFVKDKKHLLKNIHRRKPIHSHSHPPVDPERAAFDKEIQKLSREKTDLQDKVQRFKEQQSAAKSELEDMTQRVAELEGRQINLITSLEKEVKNPAFVEHLAWRIEYMHFIAYKKKRRLPQADHSQIVAENNIRDNQSSFKPELVNISHQDFSNKLTLELSQSVSDMNLVSNSTQSSNEDWGSSPRKPSEEDVRDSQIRRDDIRDARIIVSDDPFAPETTDLSDTGTSLTFKMDSSLSQKAGGNENSGMQQQSSVPAEDADGHISCHLNLTLASSPFQASPSHYSARISHHVDQEVSRYPETGSNANDKGSEDGIASKIKNSADDAFNLSSLHGTHGNNLGPMAAPARVNDLFWEQFLTERPGSSDNEEASSSYRANPCDGQVGRGLSHGMSRTTKTLGKLTL
ncbi:hypothetical protein Nepgr_022111 [Nepenthes gracilis]|uniref:HSF-type DNA-binding domain-containing protein n=1 Tax=Nepenthes gracilis TaxID=150966 RepID=A0AAD3SYT8_NEPGR|nr:hypothetical protein Nepgr_022111 [Nepenthes gracilis]